MIRITTNGALRSYKSNLMGSGNHLNAARNTVLTQRNFNSYAEDPAAATQAFQLRRSLWRTSDQLTNSTAAINKYESAWESIDTVVDDLGNTEANVAALRGLNDATGAGREPLAKVLSQSAQSVVQNMNVKYGDSFIFAGSDGLNTPFNWDEKTGNLLYRGVNVNAGGVPKPTTKEPLEGETVIPEEWQAYYQDQKDLARLEKMNKETTYVDLGMGLQADEDGNLIASSAFNSALSGIGMLGYGVDADGDPKNVASIMVEISKIFSRCDKQSGKFSTDPQYAKDEENANRLTDKLKASLSQVTSKHTEMDVTATFLNTNQERLETSSDTLNGQILSVEQCNLADAITSFSWAQYCYNAALKVGNSILSQSLIDYMN